MKAVRFSNFARAVAIVRPELDAALARVLDSGWFLLGEEVRAFEAEFARHCRRERAVAVGSGTDAIELALRVCGVGHGDEVVTQANTCVPTVAAIARAGGTPVLCDVDPDSGMIELSSLADVLSERTRAVVPVHLYGQPADMDGLMRLARTHDLVVVEDCAQATGAAIAGVPVGTSGEAGAFSFYPTKNLGALGDAGAVVVDDPELAGRLLRSRQYGYDEHGVSVHAGVNSRTDELQAAVLRMKLQLLDAAVERRRAIASVYDAALTDTPAAPLKRLQGTTHGFHLYVVRVRERDRFRSEMHRRGVETLVHYPHAIHEHPAFRGQRRTSLQASEQLAREIVSLPLYPELTDGEVESVAAAARQVAQLL